MEYEDDRRFPPGGDGRRQPQQGRDGTGRPSSGGPRQDRAPQDRPRVGQGRPVPPRPSGPSGRNQPSGPNPVPRRPIQRDDLAGATDVLSPVSDDRSAPRVESAAVRTARITGRVFVSLVSVLVLLLTGIAWAKIREVKQGITTSQATVAEAPKNKEGAVNILVIGLTTRKGQNGEDLPKDVLEALHAGDGSEGGYNTNTMIVLHIPNDGSKVTAVSVPRDDYVTFVDAPDGQKSGKIKEAYGLAKDQEWNKLYNQGIKDLPTLESRSREAGRNSTIANLTKLLNVPINHFAEISLSGFYDLASQLGGVDVCLNNAVKDPKSGADFPKGKQHLNGAQALAFVRQRDGLQNNDLDRTHRQQAFLASITYKLKNQGVFGNLGALQGLIEVAKKDVVIDDKLDILTFAQEASGLTGGNTEFHTLPIKGYDKIHGQDVNVIDIPQIQAEVKTLFATGSTPPSQAPPATSGATPGSNQGTVPTGSGSTVNVRNGSGQNLAAQNLLDALIPHGFGKGQANSTDARDTSTIFYGTGAKDDADKLGQLLGITVQSSAQAAKGQVSIYLGADFAWPSALPNPNPSGQTQAAPTSAAIPTTGEQGGAVTGGDIPCVD
ncbi:LytR family transcriptional regulator [Solihabitans fulvus]|uniref:LytR family transcriptional regulator n=1 Tax=Solihabitans fulvus TaxID=1892852 RepID=A0A5B2XFF2_9PSEU|nr:LCP family protein [Solihabitans fulvus]KAA2261640.1 LytR family transcriptional regulator [Solihabitans fulvus]